MMLHYLMSGNPCKPILIQTAATVRYVLSHILTVGVNHDPCPCIVDSRLCVAVSTWRTAPHLVWVTLCNEIPTQTVKAVTCVVQPIDCVFYPHDVNFLLWCMGVWPPYYRY